MNVDGVLVGMVCALIIAGFCIWEVIKERQGDDEDDRD